MSTQNELRDSTKELVFKRKGEKIPTKWHSEKMKNTPN